MDQELSIRDVAAATGLTTHTLRYYERIGLLSRVRRARSGHRRYGPDDVRWIEFLRKMHLTGMPIRGMLEYAALLRRGDSTVTARRELLEAHRAKVTARIAALALNLEVIDRKIQLYVGKEAVRRAPVEETTPPRRRAPQPRKLAIEASG